MSRPANFIRADEVQVGDKLVCDMGFAFGRSQDETCTVVRAKTCDGLFATPVVRLQVLRYCGPPVARAALCLSDTLRLSPANDSH